jgi:hypothetical protein
MAKDSLEETVAALRREFAAGLPERLAALQLALDGLRRGVTRDTIQAFHLPTHALTGTAGSYDAHELVPHVARLATLGRRWRDAGAASPAELDEAARELDRLKSAIERFRQRV